jgi:hypothetical protein
MAESSQRLYEPRVLPMMEIGRNRMERDQIRKIIKAYLEEGIEECRWCLAVDMKRITGREIAVYNFPDGTLIHYACPRCGGEYSLYVNGWSDQYLRSVIMKLHPELEGNISYELLNEVNSRVLYFFNLHNYLDS